jgi:phage terminase small subunit
MDKISSMDDYVEAVDEDDNATRACAEILDRFAVKSQSTSAAMELEPAAKAIAGVISAYDIEDKTRVLNHVTSKASTDTAQKAGYSGDNIESEIKRQVSDKCFDGCTSTKSDNSLRLPYDSYALDRYLEKDLATVKKLINTDHHSDPEFSWVFEDGVTVETSNKTPLGKYEFYSQLQAATEKQLISELVSNEVGSFDSDPEQYRKKSLGPESRPWCQKKWDECIQSLINERSEVVERTGPRTMMIEWLADEISRSRVTTNIGDAVTAGRMAARIDQSGKQEIDEILVPARDIERELDERGVEFVGLQQEIIARNMDSDRLQGEAVSEVIENEDRQLRYWVFDATHELIPEPEATPDSLEMSHEGREWGDADA